MRGRLTSEAADLHRWLRRKIDEDAVATSAAAFAPAIIADRLYETIGGVGCGRRQLRSADQGLDRVLAVWFGAHSGQAFRLRRQVRDAVTPLLRGSRALPATGGRPRARCHGPLWTAPRTFTGGVAAASAVPFGQP